MKRRSIAALVMFLLMWPLLAEGSVQGMLVCVHGSAHPKGDAVHFHPAGLFEHGHHPCGQSPTEMCAGHRETTCRHVPVSVDYSLDNLPHRPETRPCGAALICPFECPSQAPLAMSSDHGPSNPPLPSKTVDFQKTIVLII
ncbi:MAG: hypothetical protein K9M96_04015 [Deltaproteobacteria bacterium]|nr:hypothetical protein [Deltaproteobacteria bacterium]